MKTEVSEVAVASVSEAQTGPETRACRWTITAYLQRDICFASVVGLTGCTQPVVRELPQSEAGEFAVAADAADEQPCDRTAPAAKAALDRLAERLGRDGAKIADSDIASDVRPAMLKAGAKLR